MIWHNPLKACPHCGAVANAGNIGKWHLHGHCLLSDEDAAKRRSQANSYLNKAAVYIHLDTGEIRYFGSYKEAAKHYGGANSGMFGQVIRGNRTQYKSVVPIRLHQFLAITEDELEDLLDNARQARSIARGERGRYSKREL